MQTSLTRPLDQVAASAARVDELTALYRLTDALYRAQTPDDVYSAALEAITSTLGCQRASILLHDAEGVARFVAQRGLSSAYCAAVEGHCPWEAGARDAQPVFVWDIDLTDEPEALKAVIRGEGIRALGFVPVMVHGGVVGKFMTYYDVPHVFTGHEVDLAVTIARQLGFSVERARAEQARRRAEAELRASEARFRLMAEQAPVMIWMSGPDGRCLHLNHLLREFWGVDEAAVDGFDWTFTIHPEDEPGIRETLVRSLADRSGFSLLGRYRNAAGEYRVLATEATPRLTESGDFLGMIGVNADVTERVRAEEALRASEERFRLAVEAAPSAMVMTDSAGRIVLANRNAETLFGYSREDLAGQSIEALLPARFRNGHEIHRAAHWSGSRPAGMEERELVALRKDGTEVPVEIGLSRITTPEGPMAIASVVDISFRKRTEAQRALLLAELNHRVRNTLAVVQGIAHQTFKGVEPASAKLAFEGRLAALATAHQLLTRESWQGASLARLAEDALEAAGPLRSRIATEGPEVELAPGAALALALALHELFTNAVKHGALSGETGRIAFVWERIGDAPEPRLAITWRETGGPPVTPPARQGFGSFLLNKTLANDLQGKVAIQYLREGLVCLVEVPLAAPEGAVP